MWSNLVGIILRNRLTNIIILGIVTLFFGYFATKVEISYEMKNMLPPHDSTTVVYKDFKETFGQDGTTMYIGIEDEDLFDLDHYNAYYDLTYRIKDFDGVSEVLSVARLYSIKRNAEQKKFDFYNVIRSKPQNQDELDSLKRQIHRLPFYSQKLYNKENNSALMMIVLDESHLHSKSRNKLVKNIRQITEEFSEKQDIKVYYSGLPYIRTQVSNKVKRELLLFVLLALLIASIALFLFFRSFKAVFFPLIIVLVSVIWLVGLTDLLGYQITMLSGILPPLIIVIGVENCIFLLNKYHQEYKNHGNKIKSLSRVVQRVGNAIFLTNLTTATGFAAFIVTGNKTLIEFGIVAAVSIMFVFILSLFLIPIFFSYIKPPEFKHTKHLDSKSTKSILKHIVVFVRKRRTVIYIVSFVLLAVGIFGMSRLQTGGKVVDDISKKDILYKDIMFFERQAGGVLPFEITIDTRKPKGLMNLKTLRKIDQLQDTLAEYDIFSGPLSVAEVVKFSKQAFFKENPAFYSMPNSQEKNFIFPYFSSMDNFGKGMPSSIVDSTLQKTRVSVQMANIDSDRIKEVKKKLRTQIDEIFPPDEYDVHMTGTSIVSLKGSDYLIRNLKHSLILAILGIILLMTLLFNSFKMVLISMLPNLLPLLLTAALMGYLNIPIKPSTVLIFSIALGISVDNTIHFLSRYRMELKINNWYIKPSVYQALIETGFSMIYSSIVLFFGFIIFILSSFGGIESMGYLISFTLIVAVLSNLLLLPSLLLTLDKMITTKSFNKPFVKIYGKSPIDEDEQEVKKGDENS